MSISNTTPENISQRPSISHAGYSAEERQPDWFIIGWFTVIHAIAFIAPFYFFSWGAVIACVLLYYATGMLGITLGYHRLLTHRSFKTTKWMERVLATFGVLALQRSPLEWVSHHRMHHADVDTNRDPHNARRGFWWSHIGWMLFENKFISDPVRMRRFGRDIVADPYLNWLTRHDVQVGMQVALGLALLAFGGIDYVVWGVFVRLVLVYHVTWFVNSAAHLWGYQRYNAGDISRNNWWVGLLAFGEGWHNNHHAYPDVAPAGHRWWEFDLTYLVIKGMEKVGLAWKIKKAPSEKLSKAQPKPESPAAAVLTKKAAQLG